MPIFERIVGVLPVRSWSSVQGAPSVVPYSVGLVQPMPRFLVTHALRVSKIWQELNHLLDFVLGQCLIAAQIYELLQTRITSFVKLQVRVERNANVR
jgi:hypothetical protein